MIRKKHAPGTHFFVKKKNDGKVLQNRSRDRGSRTTFFVTFSPLDPRGRPRSPQECPGIAQGCHMTSFSSIFRCFWMVLNLIFRFFFVNFRVWCWCGVVWCWCWCGVVQARWQCWPKALGFPMISRPVLSDPFSSHPIPRHKKKTAEEHVFLVYRRGCPSRSRTLNVSISN